MSRGAGLAVAARIARRELRGGLAGFRVLIVCLALGVAAIAAVGTLRAALEAGLADNGAELLGGDAEAVFTYRFASDAERAWLAARAEAVSEMVAFRSMVAPEGGPGEARALADVHAVDGRWPLVGAPVLDPPIPLAEALAGQGGRPGILLDPLIADRLGLAPGDAVRLGGQPFVFTARLLREPDALGAGMALGPRAIVPLAAVRATGLVAPGSLFESHYRLRLPAGADLEALAAEARARLGEAGVRWRDRRNAAPGARAFIDRLAAFLVIVGLAGLAVGGIGVATAVRAHVESRIPTIAILKTLGAERRTVLAALMLQIAALAGLGIAAGLALGAVLPLVALPLLSPLLPLPLRATLDAGALGEAALYGALTAALFSLWPVARAEEIRPAALFRDLVAPARRLPRPSLLAALAAVLVALV
ncbi:MAG: FtsX-like permease family protein, partial [Alphaproteobacteria bacterium]